MSATPYKGELSEISKETPAVNLVSWLEAYRENPEKNTNYEEIIEKYHSIGKKSIEEMDKDTRIGLIVNRDLSKNDMAEYIVAIAMSFDLKGDTEKIYGEKETPVERYLKIFHEMKVSEPEDIKDIDITLAGPTPVAPHQYSETKIAVHTGRNNGPRKSSRTRAS